MFRVEKAKLDREIAKWDDSGNDIIVLSKQMCMIMMEMTDFTRYVSTDRIQWLLPTSVLQVAPLISCQQLIIIYL